MRRVIQYSALLLALSLLLSACQAPNVTRIPENTKGIQSIGVEGSTMIPSVKIEPIPEETPPSVIDSELVDPSEAQEVADSTEIPETPATMDFPETPAATESSEVSAAAELTETASVAEPARIRVIYADPAVKPTEDYYDVWIGGVRGSLAELLEQHEGEDVWFSVKVTIRNDPDKIMLREERSKELEQLWESYRTQIDAANKKNSELSDSDPVNGWNLAQWYYALSYWLQDEQKRAWREADDELHYAGMIPIWEETGKQLIALGAKDVEQRTDYGGEYYALMTAEMIRAFAEDRDRYALDTTARRVRTDGSTLSDELRDWLEEAGPDTRFNIAVSLRVDAANAFIRTDGSLRNINAELTVRMDDFLPRLSYPDYETYKAAVEAGGKTFSEAMEDCITSPSDLLQAVLERNGLSAKVVRKQGGSDNVMRAAYIMGKCTAERYLESVIAGFEAEGLTAAEVLALAEDPDIKLIVGNARYSETYRAGGKVGLKLAVYMEKMSDTERIRVDIAPDATGYTTMTWDDIKAALLEKFGWNQDVDPDHEVSLEEHYAWHEMLEDLQKSPYDRAGQALLEQLTAAGLLPEESNVWFGGKTYYGLIEADLTRDEILAIAAQAGVYVIESYDIPGQTVGAYNEAIDY